MATYYARKAGNINASDVWATTPSGTAAAVTFASGDVLMANSFAITVNVTTNLGSTGEVRIDTTGGATNGGSFALSSGVTLTANVFGGSNSSCVSNGVTASIVGNIRGGTSGNAWGVTNSGTINITGNITGGSGPGAPCYGVGNSASSGIINVISGNVVGGSSATQGPGVFVGAGTVSINGTVTGGTAVGLLVSSTGNATITGTISGGANTGASNTSASARITVMGSIVGGSVAAGATNTSTGTIEATRAIGNAYGPGNTGGLTSQVGISNAGVGIVEIQELEFGAYGQSPVSGTGIRLKKANTNVAVFNYADSAGTKTLIDATANAAMPAATDVRSGVSYASGALTGSCAVPAAGSVSLGVPVDATTGTAVLTPEAVWGAATRTLTSASGPTAADNATAVWAAASRTITGGTVDTLTNAPSVPSASAIASQVRSELSVELGRIDAATSTRATPANIPTSDITAIKGKTDLLNTTRLAQVSTTEIVGNLLAQANS